jgi:hypothetical protein
MGDLGELNRHNRVLSQTRALTPLCKCVALSTTSSKDSQNADILEVTAQSPLSHRTRPHSAGGQLSASPTDNNHRFDYRPRPMLHTYLLTWL